MSICIAPNRQKSSKMLAAKQMSSANVSMESNEVRSSTGSLFHVAGPDTAKLRWPMVAFVPGTTSVPLFHCFSVCETVTFSPGALGHIGAN